jgi:AraC family transcriptional regulator, activator of mtrCDE
MDPLSHLIELSRLQPALDIRCQLEGSFVVNHEPAEKGMIPFHLVLGGDCLIRTADSSEIRMRSGDFLLLPRGDAHAIVGAHPRAKTAAQATTGGGMLSLRTNGEGMPDVDLVCGHFTSAWNSSRLLLDTLPDVFHVSLTEARSEETLKALIDLLRQETILEQPGALTIVTAMCLALFATALRVGNASSMTTPGLLALLADGRLERSVKAMVSSPARSWTLDDLAAISAMSRATFARQFKERSGMTPGAFLTELRMSRASDLLLHSRRTTADIAAEVGYESEAAFGKAFKTSRGLPPGRFRQQAS